MSDILDDYLVDPEVSLLICVGDFDIAAVGQEMVRLKRSQMIMQGEPR